MAKKRSRRAPKLDRYQQDAALEATVRYGGQESALAGLLASERSNRISTIRSAEGAAKAATAAAKASREPLRKAYHEAGLTRQEANADADRAMAGLGAAADVFKGAVARERAKAKTDQANAQASALRGVEERVAQIALGAQAARSQADTKYASAKSQIGQQFVNLASEKGAFAALSVSRQREAQRQRNAEFKKVAAQIEAQAADREDKQAFDAEQKQADRDLKASEGAKDRAAKGSGSGKKKGLTADQKDKRVSAVGRARSYIQTLRRTDPRLRRSDVAQALLGGRKIKDRNGDVALDIKPVGQLWASVALDLEFDGHVSRANRRRLRDQGISTGRQGWNTKPKPRPRPRGRAAAAQQANRIGAALTRGGN